MHNQDWMKVTLTNINCNNNVQMDKVYFGYLSSAVPLGSIQELPAKSCAEIKASEGKEMAEGKRWIYSDESTEQAIQASCHGTIF